MKKLLKVLLIIALLYIVLLIPFPQKEIELKKPFEISFVWNKDELWETLEKKFKEAKNMSSYELDSIVYNLTIVADNLLYEFESDPRESQDPIFELIENSFFEIAPLIAAQENKSDWHIRFYNRVRNKIAGFIFYRMKKTQGRRAGRVAHGRSATSASPPA